MVLLAGNIVATEQIGKGRELLGPGEFLRHTAQVDHIVRARDRVVRPQQGQPTEDVGIAAQLIERVDLRILSAEISQKVPNCSATIASFDTRTTVISTFAASGRGNG